MIKVRNNKGTDKTYTYDYKSIYVNSETHRRLNRLSIETGLSMKEVTERLVEQSYTQFFSSDEQ